MTDKAYRYIPEDWVNAETGQRVTARTLDDALLFDASPDWRKVESQPDGFRANRKRGKGWRERAIKAGEIADPEKPTAEVRYGDDVLVFDMPLATMDIEAKETR